MDGCVYACVCVCVCVCLGLRVCVHSVSAGGKIAGAVSNFPAVRTFSMSSSNRAGNKCSRPVRIDDRWY